MFALSLSWNSDKNRNTDKQIEQVIEAGFKNVELNFSLTQQRLEKINNCRKKGQIQVVSCHNFCPIPRGFPIYKALPDCYSLSSLDERERSKALKFTKKTIDTAVRLKAKAVVLHSGRVEIPDFSKHLMHLYSCSKGTSQEYKEVSRKMRKLREKHKGPFLESIFKSIKELSAYARDKNIKLGIENRIYYSEIPHLEEVGIFLGLPNVFFWLDTGHAFIMEKLWPLKLIEYLKRYSSKMIGLHIHDVLGMQDHLAPGRGEIDFSVLKPFLREDMIKVIEAHKGATSEELKQSIKILNKTFN